MDRYNAVRIFIRTVEAGSLSRAASTLDMPKSTASKFLADLEADLGTNLIQRSTRSLSLTEEGEEYYALIAPLISRFEEVDETLRNRGHRLSGRVRVDLHSSMANMVLIPALSEFQALYPDIQIAVGISDRPISLIEEGVDCVIRMGKLHDSTLIARKIYDDRIITCASAAYLKDQGVPSTPADLKKDHTLIGYFSALTGESRPLVFEKEGERIEIRKVNIQANESTGQVNMIRTGLGIGQTFQSTVKSLLASGELITVLDEWSTLSEPVSVIYPPSRRLNGRTRVFIDWFTTYLRGYSTQVGEGGISNRVVSV
ncbi:LysR family transcriptional regulator [Ochrobactrum sp. MYb379]|uniref:LysR family transcriptional regulator n=1 Tax=Ochrobactrum sp. MYb379 TaxID=2745275 RepID=UPI0030A822FF